MLSEHEADVSAQFVHDIDRVIHEPARLIILAVLAKAEEVDFRFLEAATGKPKTELGW